MVYMVVDFYAEEKEEQKEASSLSLKSMTSVDYSELKKEFEFKILGNYFDDE